MNNANKQIAVWLDHANAQIIEHTNGICNIVENVESVFKKIKRERGESNDNTRFTKGLQGFSGNEFRKNNVAANELHDYFKTLELKLKDYDEILLLGPTGAKDKLFNRLSEKKSFSNKSIQVQSKDKLTTNQLIAFVKAYFKK